MEVYGAGIIGYYMFMMAFKRVYPELYSKYSRYIDMPLAGKNEVTMQRTSKISYADKKCIKYIIAEYYTAMNN